MRVIIPVITKTREINVFINSLQSHFFFLNFQIHFPIHLINVIVQSTEPNGIVEFGSFLLSWSKKSFNSFFIEVALVFCPKPNPNINRGIDRLFKFKIMPVVKHESWELFLFELLICVELFGAESLLNLKFLKWGSSSSFHLFFYIFLLWSNISEYFVYLSEF